MNSAQSLSLSTLHNYAKGTYDLASAAQKRQLLADADFHNLYEGVALNRGTGGSINYRDNIRAGGYLISRLSKYLKSRLRLTQL